MEELWKTICSFKESPHINDPLLFHLSHCLYHSHILVSVFLSSFYSYGGHKNIWLTEHTHARKLLPWKACCQVYSLKAPGQTTITYYTETASEKPSLKSFNLLSWENLPVPKESQSCCLLAKVKSSAMHCCMILSGMRNAELLMCASSHPTTLTVKTGVYQVSEQGRLIF